MKMHHEHVSEYLKKHDGGDHHAPVHHDHVEKQHKIFEGGMPMKHHHEHVAKMCGGGKVK